jgi:hypothetical protein
MKGDPPAASAPRPFGSLVIPDRILHVTLAPGLASQVYSDVHVCVPRPGPTQAKKKAAACNRMTWGGGVVSVVGCFFAAAFFTMPARNRGWWVK